MDGPPGLRVLVLGAYGMVGGAVADRLAAEGHAVTALGRTIAAARRARPDFAWVARDIGALARPEDWAPLLAGIDVVVNCAGALQDGPRDDVAAVQSVAMRALFAACGPAGVARVVQVSAAGAAPDAPTPFMRTKAEADAALAGFPRDWVVLRPGLVIGPQAYGGTAMLRALAGWPGPVLLLHADARIQTIGIEDLAEAVLAAAEGRIPARRAYDLVEAGSHGLAGLVAALRAWLGRPPARVLPLPAAIAPVAGAVGDLAGRLGWRTPLRSTALAEIARGVRGDPGPWSAAGGPPIRPLAETLRRHPATVQERWFSRIWPLKPVLVCGLAAFWLATGAVALAWPETAAAVLTARGMGTGPALALVVGGALVDLALGALVLARRTMVPAALGMLATTAAYLVGGTLLAPDLWSDPLGPLVKALPAALPALVLLALAEER